MGFPGLPGHLQEGNSCPILVCNLFSIMGLVVTCDQVPSPTAEIPVFSTSLWLCTEWDLLGVVLGTVYLVLLIRSKVVRLEESLAPASSRDHPLQLRPVAFPVQLGRQCRTGTDGFRPGSKLVLVVFCGCK